MKSLFDTEAYNEVKQRINNLSETTQRQWGKMDAAQMLAHCKEAFNIPLSNKPYPRMMIGRLIGWMMKHKLYNDELYKQGLPTVPGFLIKDARIFNSEKQQLLALIDKFHTAGPGNIGRHPHPFFGSYNKQQWGQGMYKHLDHHLRQFGA